MVLEALTNPLRAEARPWTTFFWGFIYATAAVFLSLWIFAQYASLVMVFLASLAAIPLFYNTTRIEEEKDLQLDSETARLNEHRKAFEFLMFLFIGMVAAFTLWYLVLPASTVQSLFNVQSATITGLQQHVIANVARGGLFSKIFLNNMKVLVFCILFSFIYGMGALFILTWNASVIAVAAGNFIRAQLASVAGTLGLGTISSYFYIVSLSFVRYFIHGIPEILAYFIGGLAGGIISIAIVKHDFGTKKFEKIVLDAADLTLLAIGLLIIAAIIEVYITPVLF
ncbi:MAG TPA: stage II sporulation protein M [Candidatus Binatia bacterium]|nr:stage II sporulation protein M [Candidatus Binatia bacterium]